MATVKSLKEQNKLLAQQEERWVDIKRKADAQLKTLEKGTKEYIAQEKRIAKIEKKYKAVQDKLIDIGIQAEENFDIEDKIIELEKERLDLTKSIIRRVAELPKHQKAQLETTYGITTQMDLTTDLHRAALGYQREENSEGLKTSQHIQQQGKWLEEIATDQDKLNTLQLEMAEGWANIGTGDFTSKMAEVKKLEDEMAGKREYYLTMVGETSKYSQEAINMMKLELDRNEELIATAKAKATQQDRANALATAGAAAILGPLGKAKSALEALPFGDLISTSLQLDSVMKEFGDKFPIILKSSTGTQTGVGVVIIESMRSLYSSVQMLKLYEKHLPIIIQEYIKTDYDVRVLILDAQILGSMKREVITDGDFRSNVSLGAKSYPIELTEIEKRDSIIAAKAVSGRLVGVDFIPAKNRETEQPYILEVNSMPGFGGIEKIQKGLTVEIFKHFLNRDNWNLDKPAET